MRVPIGGTGWLALGATLSLLTGNARAAEALPGPADSAAPPVLETPAPGTSTAPVPAPSAAPTDAAAPPAPAVPSATAAEPALPADAGSDSFTGEDASENEQQHRLDLYGFADMTYTRLLIPKSSTWNRVYYPTNSFAVGNFNLYLGSSLGSGWRALAEVRFLYLPNGATSPDAAGNAVRTDTSVPDYANFSQPLHWGAIRIERIWVEHEFSTLFKLQVGQFLTPYGIWNVDHGSPAIIGIRTPAVVSTELFPAHQTGLQLYGSRFFDPIEIGYNLTLSNGRGAVEYQDFSDDKAVGGRLYLRTDALGSLTFGTTAYRGSYYDRAAKYVVRNQNGQPIVDQQYTTLSKYQEFSLGADLKWEWKHLLVQGEAIMNQVKFAEGGRPRVQNLAPPNGFQPDYRRWGYYGLVGYRTPWIQTMPYAMVQYLYSPDDPLIPPILAGQFGLNIRPTPAVVLKTELTITHFGGPGSGGWGLSPLRIWASQVAWAF
jgi:hypothetical protein